MIEIKKNTQNEEPITQNRDNLSSSSGFFRDLLTNNNKYSLHRYQIFVWTIFLGIIFVVEVLHNLEPPEFDENLLTLQGISAGTYLGFKFPERSKKVQTTSDSEVLPEEATPLPTESEVPPEEVTPPPT